MIAETAVFFDIQEKLDRKSKNEKRLDREERVIDSRALTAKLGETDFINLLRRLACRTIVFRVIRG
jgi:hypothetical protein